MARIRATVICVLVAIASLALGACGSSNGKTVDVALGDFTLKPKIASIAAGDITFKVHNNGG